jgi:hypothetical protein
MDNIVTNADFKGRYSIAISDYGEETLNDFIADEQYDLLLNIIGETLYNTYNAAPTTAAWASLRDGATGYTDVCGYVRNWRGLKYLMVPYIYSKWIDYNDLKQVQNGTVQPKFENSDPASEFKRTSLSYQAWNDFVNRLNECYDYLEANESTYTDFEDYFKFEKIKSIVSKRSIS